MLRVIAVLLAGLLLSPVYAQTPLPGFPPGVFQSRAAIDAGSAPLPSVAYVGPTITPSLFGMAATATSAATGAAGYTVLVITDIGSSSTAYSCIIAGNLMTPVVANSSQVGGNVNIQALTTPGGSQTIICTATNGTGPNATLFEIYTLTNLSSTTATGTCNTVGSAAALTCTTGYNTTSGGVAIAASSQFSNASSCPGSCSFSGTETYTVDVTQHPAGFGQGEVAHASGISTNSPSSVTFTWNASAGAALAAAAWR